MAVRPFVFKGFSPYLPAESGKAPGTVYGRLGNTLDATHFVYARVLSRRFQVAAGSFGTPLRGTWDIQLRASDNPQSKIIFDQSVNLGAFFLAAGDSMFGSIGLFFYYFFTDETENSSQGKFKTRIINGNPVKPILEDQPDVPVPVTGFPKIPETIIFIGQKQTLLQARMPELPEDAVKFKILVAVGTYNEWGGCDVPPIGSFVPYPLPALDLVRNSEIDIVGTTVSALTGATIKDLEQIFVRLVAVGEDPTKTTYGKALRDAWTKLDPRTNKKTLLCGYESWKSVYRFGGEPNILSEWGTAINESNAQVSTGGFMDGYWWSVPYTCAIPANSHVYVNHDQWGPNPSVIGNKFTYEFSYMLGEGLGSFLRDAQTGQRWIFYPDAAKMYCTRARLDVKWDKNSEEDPVVMDFVPTLLIPIRVTPNIYCVASYESSLYLVNSYNQGRTWEVPIKFDYGVTGLAACEGNFGGGSVVVFAKADKADPAFKVEAGDLIRVLIQRNKGNSSGGVNDTVEPEWVARDKHVIVKANTESDLFKPTKWLNMDNSNNRIILVGFDGDDMYYFVSTDEGKTFESIQGQTQAELDGENQ